MFLLFCVCVCWVGLGGIDVRPLVREDVLTLKKIFPLFYSHRRRHVSFSSSCVVQQQQQDSHLLSRVVGTSQRFLENWGGRSRVEEWEENQIGLHVKDLVTLFIRRWRILLNFFKKRIKNKIIFLIIFGGIFEKIKN